MPDKVEFSKELRQKNKETGGALFGVGVEDDKTRATLHSPSLTVKAAWNLFRFCTLIHKGKSPKEAFSEVYDD